MTGLDLSSLIDSERGIVDPEIYHSREIYELELEKVFGRCWLFLAHDSMIPKPGDFIQTYVGEDPVLVVRQRDHTVKAFLNQCRHRGMRICRSDLGNTKVFTCSYHGWAYDTAGKLINVPHEEDGFYNELDKDAWGPTQVAQIHNYKGYIFGTWDPTAPDFETYLGEMAWYFDAWCDLWEGGTEIVGGGVRWVMDCNWKFAAEQFASDTYHGAIAHASVAMVAPPPGFDPATIGAKMARWTANSRQYSSPLGHGTGFNIGGGLFADMEGVTEREQAVLNPFWEESLKLGVDRLGELRAQGMGGGGHYTIFPTFSFLSVNRTMRVWQPRGPEQLGTWSWISVPANATDEVKEAIRRLSLRAFTPAGLLEQDDGENWNEIQKVLKGWMARQRPFNTGMGLGHSKVGADGLPGRTSYGFTEDAARHFYQRWVNLLAAKTWEHLDELTRTDPHLPAERVSLTIVAPAMFINYGESARWTDVEGTRFYSNEAGTGDPLICLHGGGPGANAWDNSQHVFSGLSQQFRTILLDLPHYGQSSSFERLDGESDDRMYARALIAFLDARGIESAHFFATSMSTAYVLRLAIEHPQRVDRLVLKAPAAMPSWFTPFPTPGLVAMFAYLKEPTRANMEALMRAFVPRAEAFSPDMVDARLHAAQRTPPVAPGGPPIRLLDDLGSVDAATLVLAGRDDRMVPFEGALHLLGALRNARLHVWGGGTGHFPEWEHAAEFVSLVTDFLR